MTQNNVYLQLIRRNYVDIDFDELYKYAKSLPWTKIGEFHCITPIDEQIRNFLMNYNLYNPSYNYLMLIDKTEELKEEP